jgi:hypothetical protein
MENNETIAGKNNKNLFIITSDRVNELSSGVTPYFRALRLRANEEVLGAGIR